MTEQQTISDSSYEYLCAALQRFPKARIPTREEFDAVSLRAGKGSGQEGDFCSVQVVRLWEGLDPESDTVPDTDSQVCGRFIIRFQDSIADTAVRTRLMAPLLVKLVGSAGSPELELRRSWLAVDWALREVAPAYFDMSPELAIHAAALRALPPITDRASATAANAVRDRARAAAWELRQAKLTSFREKFRAELAKHPALTGKPAAEAVAAAVAAARAAEVAAAVAAEAAAVAAEAAAVYGSDLYWEIRAAVREALLKHLRESTAQTTEKLRAIQRASWESGAACLERMLDLKEESTAA